MQGYSLTEIIAFLVSEFKIDKQTAREIAIKAKEKKYRYE
jgi:hypothetical protein